MEIQDSLTCISRTKTLRGSCINTPANHKQGEGELRERTECVIIKFIIVNLARLLRQSPVDVSPITGVLPRNLCLTSFLSCFITCLSYTYKLEIVDRSITKIQRQHHTKPHFDLTMKCKCDCVNDAHI